MSGEKVKMTDEEIEDKFLDSLFDVVWSSEEFSSNDEGWKQVHEIPKSLVKHAFRKGFHLGVGYERWKHRRILEEALVKERDKAKRGIKEE